MGNSQTTPLDTQSTPLDTQSTPLDTLREKLNSHPQIEGRQRGILLTTGSLNPIHRMHLTIFDIAAKHLSEECNIDVLLGFVSPSCEQYVQNKLGQEAIPFDQRFQMCNLAVSEHNQSEYKNVDIEVDPWEGLQNPEFIDFPEVRARLDSLIQKEFPQENLIVFYLCGLDHFLKCRLDNWNNVIAVVRPPYTIQLQNDPSRGIYLLFDDRMEDVSSTEIRKRREKHLSISDLTFSSVENFLKEIQWI